ncbi:CpsB/CapC family capsule biosynthesis tyrosine phosphatase [uncultured Ruminococcus sp.]|uniref:CpsB/CapC family capsule biosynthesis tyrosine phosphatase n=1 Tax=uncultured Ruminococcus sp. TaxID=165186 RepID=UPI0025E893FC|nr:CpsB/CapC family capsule biosynthesis tyrosine phosphatase [uncultured Ruminococcus sp.]
MLTDYHCHILPEFDDGAVDAETSLEMINIMKEQGVERIIATPHFYAHEERSLTEYLLRREDAYESMAELAAAQNMILPNIALGAEVAIEHGISKIHGIDKLAIEDSEMILLELPFRDYEEWMSEEINAIRSEYDLTVVLAHIHRYMAYYTPENFDRILQTDAVFQFNNEVFLLDREAELLKQLRDEKRSIIFGSDAHNTDTRRPNWDLLLERCDPEVIKASNELLPFVAEEVVIGEG